MILLYQPFFFYIDIYKNMNTINTVVFSTGQFNVPSNGTAPRDYKKTLGTSCL